MSGFLVDTNVISEIIKPAPDERVAGWSREQPRESLFLSVISIGELRKGLTILPPSERRKRLEQAIEESLTSWFGDRVLPLTRAIAEHWGTLDGQRQLAGRPLNIPDGQIAATAREHGLTVVGRNIRDFEGLGVQVLNPWTTPPLR